MLTKSLPLNKLHFKTDEQYKSSIRLSNLKDPPHNNKIHFETGEQYKSSIRLSSLKISHIIMKVNLNHMKC